MFIFAIFHSYLVKELSLATPRLMGNVPRLVFLLVEVLSIVMDLGGKLHTYFCLGAQGWLLPVDGRERSPGGLHRG